MERVLEIWKGDYLIGLVFKYSQGHQFMSKVSSHKNGRKFHEDAHDAVPAWAKKMADNIVEVGAA